MDTGNFLSLLEGYVLQKPIDAALKLAADFRSRRVERGLTRKDIAIESGVPLANIARFEQKGAISLKNLVMLALAMGYLSEVRDIFAQPKYSTMEELQKIRKNRGKKKAYHSKKQGDEENRKVARKF